MAHQFANTIPTRLLMWQRVREYAVPLPMIEIATARRAVGDWAGACAAARVDTDLDLRAVRDRHGTELATRLRADLRRLAPDLLRWHMPRIFPDGQLRPGLTVSLSRYPTGDSTQLQLVVRTPPGWANAGQRMSLALWEGLGTPEHHPHPHPSRRFRLDLHRPLWDSTRYDELAMRCGASQPGTTAPVVDDRSWASGRWAAEAELLLEAEGRPSGAFTVRLGARSRAVLELVAPDESHAPTYRQLRGILPPQQIAALPMLPEAAARVLPDLELLRAGLITPGQLHPLVATALASTAAATPPALTASAGFGFSPGSAAAIGAGIQPADPHRVECRGEVHRIALRAGVLVAIDHDPVQLRREELLVALGGPALPCLRAIDAVQREPEALPAVRERIDHGDIAGALNVVEGLLGSSAILRDGPLREELESAAARRIDHGLFRSGLGTAHASSGGNASDPERTERGHRPRPNRRTPAGMHLKRNSRQRPRTVLA
jgi:hypothetical protein